MSQTIIEEMNIITAEQVKLVMTKKQKKKTTVKFMVINGEIINP